MYLLKPATQPGVGTQLVQRVDGLGCACKDGLGLFDGGLDFSTWGIAEWATLAGGAYTLMSLFSTTKRGYRAAREGVKSTRRALKRNPGKAARSSRAASNRRARADGKGRYKGSKSSARYKYKTISSIARGRTMKRPSERKYLTY